MHGNTLPSQSSLKSLSVLKEQLSHARDAGKTSLPTSPMERAKKRSQRHKLLKTSVSARALLQFQNGASSSSSSLNDLQESATSPSASASTSTPASAISNDSAKKLDTILRGEMELKKRLREIEKMLRNMQQEQPSKPSRSFTKSQSTNKKLESAGSSHVPVRPAVVLNNLNEIKERDKEYSMESITERLQKYKAVAKRPELQNFLRENNL